MDHLLPIHGVATAGQRNPQLLPRMNLVRGGYVVDLGNFLVRDEEVVGEPSYVVEAGVGGLDGVDWGVVGAALAAGASAGERNADDGAGGDGVGGGRGEGEVVGAEELGEGGDLEEGEDGAVGGAVGGDVAGKALAGGRSRAVESDGFGRRGEEEEEEEEGD